MRQGRAAFTADDQSSEGESDIVSAAGKATCLGECQGCRDRDDRARSDSPTPAFHHHRPGQPTSARCRPARSRWLTLRRRRRSCNGVISENLPRFLVACPAGAKEPWKPDGTRWSSRHVAIGPAARSSTLSTARWLAVRRSSKATVRSQPEPSGAFAARATNTGSETLWPSGARQRIKSPVSWSNRPIPR